MATQKMIAEEEHIAQYGEREVVGETHKDKKTLNVAVTMDENDDDLQYSAHVLPEPSSATDVLSSCPSAGRLHDSGMTSSVHDLQRERTSINYFEPLVATTLILNTTDNPSVGALMKS